MIVRIHGVLEAVQDRAALVWPEGGLTYEVLLSSYVAARLGGSIGQPITLEIFHYFEAQNQGATMIPRLAGFLTAEDREFFEVFTSVKGIGNRRALRAMALSTAQIAAAITDRDLALLQSLPEIGRRTAETVVATLHGKVERFLTAGAGESAGAARAAGTGAAAGGAVQLTREALEVLLQLGENRVQALNWIDQAGRDPADKPRDVQDLIARVYRIKSGA